MNKAENLRATTTIKEFIDKCNELLKPFEGMVVKNASEFHKEVNIKLSEYIHTFDICYSPWALHVATSEAVNKNVSFNMFVVIDKREVKGITNEKIFKIEVDICGRGSVPESSNNNLTTLGVSKLGSKKGLSTVRYDDSIQMARKRIEISEIVETIRSNDNELIKLEARHKELTEMIGKFKLEKVRMEEELNELSKLLPKKLEYTDEDRKNSVTLNFSALKYGKDNWEYRRYCSIMERGVVFDMPEFGLSSCCVVSVGKNINEDNETDSFCVTIIGTPKSLSVINPVIQK